MWEEPAESCKTGVGPDLIGVALMNGLLFFKMIPDLDC